MNIDKPKAADVEKLRALGKEAFSDTDEFLDLFFRAAFSPERCRCAFSEGRPIGALYWFDASYSGEKIAYLYAIATAREYRGRGVCAALMENTHRHLAANGYEGAILVPSSPELFRFYEKRGYRICSRIGEIRCAAEKSEINIKLINVREYEAARRRFLPRGSVIQEKDDTDFKEGQGEFYIGEDFLLYARRERDSLFGIELLGNKKNAPKILYALGFKQGIFRIPEGDIPFATYHALGKKELSPPEYFGLAYD